jgi:intracellular sulfur oxidation DsrE/DsrF family protein
MQRSMFLNSTVAAAAACAAVGCTAKAGAIGLVETASQFNTAAFDKLVSKDAEIRHVWDAGSLHPQILGGVKNGLNGIQFGFGVKPERIATALVAHNESNLMLYDDSLWSEFHLGDIFGVRDPGGNLVVSNIFAPARSANTVADPSDVRGYYQDASVEALQRRGVMFFACNTALVQQAERIVNAGGAKGKSAADIANQLRAHVLPGVIVVPSGVGTIAYLQSRYHYAYTTEQA